MNPKQSLLPVHPQYGAPPTRNNIKHAQKISKTVRFLALKTGQKAMDSKRTTT